MAKRIETIEGRIENQQAIVAEGYGKIAYCIQKGARFNIRVWDGRRHVDYDYTDMIMPAWRYLIGVKGLIWESEDSLIMAVSGVNLNLFRLILDGEGGIALDRHGIIGDDKSRLLSLRSLKDGTKVLCYFRFRDVPTEVYICRLEGLDVMQQETCIFDTTQSPISGATILPYGTVAENGSIRAGVWSGDLWLFCKNDAAHWLSAIEWHSANSGLVIDLVDRFYIDQNHGGQELEPYGENPFIDSSEDIIAYNRSDYMTDPETKIHLCLSIVVDYTKKQILFQTRARANWHYRLLTKRLKKEATHNELRIAYVIYDDGNNKNVIHMEGIYQGSKKGTKLGQIANTFSMLKSEKYLIYELTDGFIHYTKW